jgi:hypothetical protein
MPDIFAFLLLGQCCSRAEEAARQEEAARLRLEEEERQRVEEDRVKQEAQR